MKDREGSLKRMAMCPQTSLHGLQSDSHPLLDGASDNICEVDRAHLADEKTNPHGEGT